MSNPTDVRNAIKTPRILLGPLAFAFAVAAACSRGDEGNGPPPPAGVFALDDGTEVDVSAAGRVVLRRDGRTIFATAEGARITTATFDERVQGVTGIWAFERLDEVRTPAGGFRGASKEGSAVVVRFDGDTTMRIAPHKNGMSMVRVDAPKAKATAVPLACDDEATFFGFGEQWDAVEHRGHAIDLFLSEQGIGRQPGAARAFAGDEHTSYFPMPYFVDARGFGVLVKTPHRTLADVCKSDAKVAWLEIESSEPVEMIVLHGPTAMDVVRQLGDEVGRPRVPPDWAFGTWIGAQGGRDAVLARVARAEAAKIPATAFWVQDWTGERRNLDGGYGVQYRWREDAARYPDLAGMVAELHARGYRFLSYANPFVVRGLDHFDAMSAGGMLVKNADGAVYEHVAPNGKASTPDFTNPATYDYVRSAFRDMVTRLGHDGFMADFGEWAPLDGVFSDGSDPRAEHNLFPLRWHSAWRTLFDELRPDGDYAVFARSGWTGVQAVAQIYWVGDQEADFSPHDGLPTVATAMMSLGFAGIPFVTHDVAGFSGGPSTKELYQRWTELGAFSPILRTHDGNKKDENWSWDDDDETTAHFARMSIVHQRLVPELVALAREAGESGAPLVRHLVLAYPDDRQSRTTHDEYLLGDRLLVAPITSAGATSRKVYFPPGSAWFHVFTGARFEGGTASEVEAPIGTPAVFAKDADRTDLRAP